MSYKLCPNCGRSDSNPNCTCPKAEPAPMSLDETRRKERRTQVTSASACIVKPRLVCTKCEFQGIQGPIYERAHGKQPESLRYTCRQCGYTWTTRTADRQK